MNKKNLSVILALMCMLLPACSNAGSTSAKETTVITKEETTPAITEMTEATETEATVSETTTVQSEAPSETEVTIDMTEELYDEASRLMGALDYIDCIGGGNIPKDENDVTEIDGRQYAKVIAQFENTADLEEFITSNLSDSLIQSRYSHILGGEEPYYIDVDGALYGYVTAKGCGYPWILENDKPVISISDVSDSSFTAVTKFDNFGGESEMKLDIVFIDGFWKINSISYEGMTF
ncbi:MAG: hypothetical protein ACI4RG_09305 [Huintestinicola sp.]